MSAPPGAFENSGGVQPPNGSGQQPAKRPKMDDQLRSDGPQQGGPQSGGGSNPLDSIFPDSGGGGMALPDELMNRNNQSTPVSQQKQMPNNGATQLQQVSDLTSPHIRTFPIGVGALQPFGRKKRLL